MDRILGHPTQEWVWVLCITVRIAIVIITTTTVITQPVQAAHQEWEGIQGDTMDPVLEMPLEMHRLVMQFNHTYPLWLLRRHPRTQCATVDRIATGTATA